MKKTRLSSPQFRTCALGNKILSQVDLIDFSGDFIPGILSFIKWLKLIVEILLKKDIEELFKGFRIVLVRYK